MARIRSIKPELPADKGLAGLPIEIRYTFVLLISQSDDYGLIEAKPRQLLGSLYPHDDGISEPMLLGWIRVLVENEKLRWRQTKDGAPVLEIVNWTRHQSVKNPGKPILLNKLRKFDGNPPASLTTSSVDSTPILRNEKGDLGGAERERDLGEGEGKGSFTPDSACRKSSGKPPTRAAWVAEAVKLWHDAVGVVTFGHMGNALKPAVDQHGWDTGDPKGQHVKRWLMVYLDCRPYTRRDGSIWGDLATDNDSNAPTRDTRFCSPADFVKNLATWRARCEPLKATA